MRLVFSACMAFLLVGCQATSGSNVRVDDRWSTGTLENGLTYHVFSSPEHEDVSIRLIFQAGSLQETDQQRGYAHFVEHMAFNGSEHFEGNEFVEFARRIGVTFGHGTNAFTSGYETVYKLDLPNATYAPEAMDWFSDIAQGLTFSNDEVEKEKEVLIGEWRASRAGIKQAGLKLYEHVAKGSKLEERDPIGQLNQLQQATPASLREFYDKWYQPQLAHIVVVGDIEATEVQSLMAEKFSEWQRGVTQIPERYQVPELDKDTALYTAYPNEGTSTVMLFDLGSADVNDKAGLYALWTQWESAYLIAQKLQEVALRITGDQNSIQVWVDNIGERRQLIIRSQFPEEARDEAQLAIAETLATLRDHGADASLASSIGWGIANKKQLIQRDSNLNARDRADQYARNLLYSYPNLSVDDEDSLRLGWSRNVNKDSLFRSIESMLSRTPSTVAFVDPSEDRSVVTKQLAMARELFSLEGEAPAGKTGKAILAMVDKTGSVVAERSVTPSLRVWTLGNGMEVWYQQNPKAKKDLRIVLGNKGGRSIIPDEMMAASYLMPDTLFLSGLAGLDSQQLSGYLNDKNIAIWPEVSPTRHAVHLGSSREQLNDALLVLHHAIQNPTFSEEALKVAKRKLTGESRNFFASAGGAFDKEVFYALRDNDPSYMFVGENQIAAATLDQVEKVHQNFFQTTDNTKIYIVGDVSPSRLKRAVGKYLAGIDVAAPPADVALKDPQEWPIDADISLGIAQEEKDKGFAALYVLSPIAQDDSAESAFINDILQRIVMRRVINIVREQKGLSYAPNTWQINVDNEDRTGWGFAATVDPKRAKEANDVFESIAKALSQGVSEEEFNVATAQFREAMQNLDQNAHDQANIFSRYLINGWGVEALLDVNGTIDDISYQEVLQRTKLIFSANSKFVRAYNMPKGESLPE